MRLFYLTTEFLWPPHQGGRVRSLAQLQLLARLPEVRELLVFSLTEVAIQAAERTALSRALCAADSPRVEVLPPLSHPIHLRQALRALLAVAVERLRSGQPYLAAKWRSAAIGAALTRALGERPPDVVYIDHLGMAVYLPEIRRACPRARVVLEEHNVESELFRQFAARRLPPWSALAHLEHRAAARFEAETLRAVDAVVAISAADAQGLRALAGTVNPVVVPPAVEPAPVPRTASSAPRLCYVGNLTWHPNVEGLDWFFGRVWPQVLARLPDATLTIAGSGLATDAAGRPQPPRRWQRPGVRVVGYLPELLPLYRDSLAVVAPILSGSGVRIKLLEALRAGMPVVTTPAGAAGLALHNGVEVLIEAEPARFAGAVATLCKDAALRQRLVENGFRYLSAHHHPDLATRALRRALGL